MNRMRTGLVISGPRSRRSGRQNLVRRWDERRRREQLPGTPDGLQDLTLISCFPPDETEPRSSRSCPRRLSAEQLVCSYDGKSKSANEGGSREGQT